MGSDIGKTIASKASTIRLLAAFLAGCLSTLFLLSISRETSVTDDSCQISVGTYKGKQYTTEKGGTVGNPKCLVESKFLKVQQHSVQLPADLTNDGKPAGIIVDDWIWIDYHDSINVLIEAEESSSTEEPHFLIFQQTKYALEGLDSLATVGGIIEPGENPDLAAQREVLEETAMDCATFSFLGRYRTDVNRGMGWTYTYVASDCKKQQKQTAASNNAADEVGGADTERQVPRILSLTDIRKAVQAGEFLEIKWSATVALAVLHYDEQARG